jgi:hypothetical protein
VGQPGRIYSRAPSKWHGSKEELSEANGRGVERAEEDLLSSSSYGTRAETRLGRGATLFASESLNHAP